jgi:hypothetical protein
MDLLVHAKEVLIKDGYQNTLLVIDRQTVGQDPLEISQQSLEFSDINIFVFTRTGKRQGVPDEIATLTTDRRLFEKIQFSIVFNQVKGGKSSLPSLTNSRVDQNHISCREFGETAELDGKLLEHVYWMVVKWAKFRGI